MRISPERLKVALGKKTGTEKLNQNRIKLPETETELKLSNIRMVLKFLYPNNWNRNENRTGTRISEKQVFSF